MSYKYDRFSVTVSQSRKVGKHRSPILWCHFSPFDFPQPEIIPAKEVGWFQISAIESCSPHVLISTKKPFPTNLDMNKQAIHASFYIRTEYVVTAVLQVVVEAQRYNIDSRPLYTVPSHDNPDTFNFVSVEGLAMHHYSAAESWPCAVHAEKSTFSLLFCLLMWDTIFCPGVPNVFRTKLQVMSICKNFAVA